MDDHTGNELQGKISVVTGSSSGIGRAIALELAAAGSSVVVHGRHSADALSTLAQEIQAAGRSAESVLADVAEQADQERLVEHAWGWKGGVDIWVNCAGADVLTGEAARWSFEKKLERLWQVDVAGTIRLSRLVGARMKARGSGVILNIGWDQAELGMAGDSGELFAAIKGSVMAFTRSLAQSLAPQVRVNCLAPGWIKTAWGEKASQEWQRRAVNESLLKRWGTPEDVARAARFLASPAASFVTGQTVAVNGGRSTHTP